MKFLKKVTTSFLSSKFYWAVFVILSILKILLISNNEILALFSPHDELWHISSAEHAFWFVKEYTQMTFIQYPIYPLFIFATHFTGIPLRISIELLFILSGFLLSFSLIKAGLNKILGIFCFSLIIFQPVSFYLFDHTLAETLYTPLLLLSIASFVQLWIIRNNINTIFFSISTGTFLALLWLTRKESLLIAIFILFILLVILFESFKNKYPFKNVLSVIKKVVIIPSAIIFFSYIIVCSVNYYTFGIFAPSELDANGYKSAYNALQRIQTKNTIRYVPVSSEAREIAYSVSPSFEKLRPFLEDKNNFAFYWTKKAQGIDNEMAAGWFYWILRDAVYNAGFKTASSADLFYKQIATEINSALKEKRIESRMVLIDFIDPSFYKYLSQMPSSFFKLSMLFIDTQKPKYEFDNIETPGGHKDLIDKMANRRTALVNLRHNQISTISGWALSTHSPIISIALLNSTDEILTSTNDLQSRPDVEEFYKKDGFNPQLNSGFTLSYHGDKSDIQKGSLKLTYEDKTLKIPVDPLKKNKLIRIEDDDNALLLTIEKKNIPKSKISTLLTEKIQKNIWKVYGNIILILSCISLFILILSIRKIKELKADNLTLIIIIFFAFLIITRMLLFSLLDIASWDGSQPRYIFPIMPLYGAMLLLIINNILPKKNAIQN